MNQLTSLYLAALNQVVWQQPDDIEFPDPLAQRWLLEQGSLSRLMATHCGQLTVDLLSNQMMPADSLSHDELQLLHPEEYLLRQVIIHGDQQPWVFGHTLIPLSSMLQQQYDLMQQGQIPLGLTVFSADNVKRDALQVGWVETELGRLLARRSRLWMNHKPMLVTELFLATSPIYSKERV
ncbi:chorismate lyase [Vibrio mimicus]|uniref:chorismate lyase n=1 Tax=Vibrio mimicus TaxID=674 RepID=UPI000878C935|nr:chorismate lyase [Vibrio mimicus]AOW81315.1 chorismate--pyruvate lyase [Vibrio mimicus]